MTREDIERMTTAPDCFVPTPEVVRELARRALAPDRARRVGEAVLRIVADDSFDAYDLGVEVREIVDAFGGEP